MRIASVPLPSPDVAELVALIASSDGTSPVNELGELALAGSRDAVCLVCLVPLEQFHLPDTRVEQFQLPDREKAPKTPDSANWQAELLNEPNWQQEMLTGFALIDPREQTVQLGVHPSFRRRGVGTALGVAASSHPDARHFWAFGNLPGAPELAARLGLTKERELYVMARPLDEVAPTPAPPGVVIDTFAPEDAAAVVEVNAAAFAHHPEQGNLTLDDFHTLTDQPWFDPAGLFVARRDGRVVGFHWTKVHTAAAKPPGGGESSDSGLTGQGHTAAAEPPGGGATVGASGASSDSGETGQSPVGDSSGLTGQSPVGEVYVLGVHPDAEGIGLGRSLLEAGLAHLHALGLPTVKLYVESSSSRVVAMYQAATFEVIHTDASYAKDAR